MLPRIYVMSAMYARGRASFVRVRTAITRRAMFLNFAIARAHTSSTHGVSRATVDVSERTRPSILDEFSLTGKVALVTGANSGLGLEGALALVEAGARSVYCVDIAHAPGAEWLRVREFVSRMRGEDNGRQFEYIRGDVSDQEGMWKIGKTIGDREGRLDSVRKLLDVDLKGPLYTAQAAGQQMVRFANGGSIVLVASIAGHVTVNLGLLPYEIAKGGVIQMARSLACELAPQGIRVSSISPGFHKTPMLDKTCSDIPGLREKSPMRSAMKRLGEPHELRGVVAWLASEASSFCTGSDIVVDGGHCAH
ncbi:hypothetical protein C8Q77DRAFT_645397 [Trametes polyzona]|nr:hypothetical protein C8Q77DRAFT_645397 [Trametes polyzona]